ncbi:MAG: hypothetical protein H6R09_944, partial [Proteobacteria bacterium]|nr:hypothetical protein [Pseudomonadota bacterium]
MVKAAKTAAVIKLTHCTYQSQHRTIRVGLQAPTLVAITL